MAELTEERVREIVREELGKERQRLEEERLRKVARERDRTYEFGPPKELED